MERFGYVDTAIKLNAAIDSMKRNACDTVFIVMRLDEKESKLFWCAVKTNTSVKELAWSGCVDNNPGKWMPMALQSNSTITTLGIWNAQTAVEIEFILKSLKSNRSISKLGFSDVGLGDKGLVLVGKLLQTHKFVRAIWIQDDKFSAQALHDFFGCIMHNISSLGLSDCIKNDACFREISNYLQSTKILHTLDLSYNTINILQMQCLCRGFHFNTSVHTLDMVRMNIGDAEADVLLKALEKHRTVKRLILSLNNIQILPYGFVHLNLQSLELRGNDSLRFPPENIAASGSKAILAFFTDLKKGSVKVRHAKIMLVGHGRAGKSTLAKALHMQPADVGGLLQELKDKADMKNWSIEDVKEFLHDRGYSADLGKLLHKHKVNGVGLMRLVKNAKLLSELGLHPIRAQSLIGDVEHYNSVCFALRYVRTREVVAIYMRLYGLKLQVLDYAGQLEQYVSHSLFAQDSEALFCVVADISSPAVTVKRTTSAWCSFIGGISPQKPSVVLTMTHLDKIPESEHKRLILNLSKFVKKNHSNISVVGCTDVNYDAHRIVESLKKMKVLLHSILKEKLEGKFIPKSYVSADQCLQKEFLDRQARQDSQIVSFAEIRKLLVRSVPQFHDNHEFFIRVLKFLHHSGKILFNESGKFIVLEPYTWFTNILSLFLREQDEESLIPHQHGLIMLRDILRHYQLFGCKRADVKRIMQLLCEYRICFIVEGKNPGYLFPSLLPAIDAKVFQRYWSVSCKHGEGFVGRRVTCKNAMDSISRGFFCALQVRLRNEVLLERKDAVCVCGRNIVIIQLVQSTIQVVLKRKNDTFSSNTIEILARGAAPFPLLQYTMRTIKHHLHRFSPNLAMLWSAICPPCCMLSSCKQRCLFPMKFKKKRVGKLEMKKQASGLDLSSCCASCASTELHLVHCNMYMHRGISSRALSAAQVVGGMLVSEDANRKDEQSEEKKDLTKEIAQLSRQMKQGFKGMKHGFKGMKQGFKGTADQMKQGFTAAADQTEAVGLAVYNIVLTKSPDLSTGVDVKPTNKHKSHK